MINFYLRKTKDANLKTIFKFQKNCLICCIEPTEKELSFCKRFLNRGMILDAMDQNEIPRIEINKKTVYIFLRSPLEEKGEIITAPFLVAISPKFFFILSSKKNEFINKFINGREVFYTTQRTKLFIQILSNLIKSYDFFVSQINKKTRSFGLNFQKIKDQEIKQFLSFEIILQDFINTLLHTKYLFLNVKNKNYLKLFIEDKELIEDIILNIEQIESISEANVKNIVRIREAHEVILTNNVNRAVKLLTALTIIVSVPTIIASFYGMNISLPFSGSSFVFYFLIFLSFASMALLIFIFRKKEWI